MTSHFRHQRDELIFAPEVRFTMPFQVRLQDIDAAGIMFFAKILETCHDAYIQFWQALGLTRELLQSSPWVSPIVHAEADYLEPLRFLERVDVQIVQLKLDDKKYALGFRVVRSEEGTTGAVVAIARMVFVFVDAVHFKRVEIPWQVRSALEKRPERGPSV